MFGIESLVAARIHHPDTSLLCVVDNVASQLAGTGAARPFRGSAANTALTPFDSGL
jgi:hypothetical protein